MWWGVNDTTRTGSRRRSSSPRLVVMLTHPHLRRSPRPRAQSPSEVERRATAWALHPCAGGGQHDHRARNRRGTTYLVKCFFFAAFSFWLTGVIILSVGDMYLGLLSNKGRQRWPPATRVMDILVGHLLCQECLRSQAWCLARESICRIAQGRLGNDDVRCLRRVVQRLDVDGRVVGRRGGRHGGWCCVGMECRVGS